MDDLFSELLERKRQLLKKAGWDDMTGMFGSGYRCWREPKTFAVVSEAEAFVRAGIDQEGSK